MAANLDGMRIAILVADGFEQVELLKPREALDEVGANTDVVSPAEKKVRAWDFTDWGNKINVDVNLTDARAEDYDALLLPGGVMNPDTLRIIPAAVAFVKDFVEARKPIASICHGPWTLIEAGATRGRRMTSWPSLRSDLTNAGAAWIDEEVVVDKGVVTSRKPDDIPAFNREMIKLFSGAKTLASQAA
jgi:protease I